MEGKSLQQIAREFGISNEGVGKMCQKLQETGKPENSARSARKRKTTARGDRLIAKQVKTNPFVTARQIKENLCLPISTTQSKSRIKRKHCSWTDIQKLTIRFKSERTETSKFR